MNLGISNVHYNVDEKQGPLYIALRTGHIYIYALCTGHIYYICPVRRAIYDDIALEGGLYVDFTRAI